MNPSHEPSVDATVRVLLATDFDGTIAPIVSRPDQAFIHPVAERFLRSCGETPSVAVAVISGRDVDDLRRRIGRMRAIVAGSHGLECQNADGRVLWTTERRCPELPPSLLRELLRDGLRVERKKFSLAVHFRDLAGEAESHERRISSWADEQNLDVISGRKVVEIRVRGGGKRAALRAIAGHVGAEHLVYAGDDMSDFPALAYAAACGHAIFVESDERDAPNIPGLWRAATIEDLCYGFVKLLLDAAPDAVPSLVGSAARAAALARIPSSSEALFPPDAGPACRKKTSRR